MTYPFKKKKTSSELAQMVYRIDLTKGIKFRVQLEEMRYRINSFLRYDDKLMIHHLCLLKQASRDVDRIIKKFDKALKEADDSDSNTLVYESVLTPYGKSELLDFVDNLTSQIECGLTLELQ